MATDLFPESSEIGPTHIRRSLPGPAREAALRRLRDSLNGRAALLLPAAAELRGLVLSHDPLELVSSIAVPAGMALDGPGLGGDDAQVTATWDAKIEYLVGLTLSAERGSGGVDEGTTARAIELIADVFDGAQAELMLRAWDEDPSGSEGLDRATFLLRSEYLVDRMAGYACHLEAINAEVFDPHREFYVEHLGFCPSDLVRLVRRHVSAMNEMLNNAVRAVRRAFADNMTDEEKALAMNDLLGILARSRHWEAEPLSARTGLQMEEVAAMLDHLSARLGCQPNFLLPYEKNRARTHPLVALGEGHYFAPLPWSMAHCVHEWMQATIAEDGLSALGDRYRRHRSDAHERLINRGLAMVFGPEHTWASVHYEASTGHGEIDCLVDGFHPMVVEGKSQSLTPAGRRGYRERVDRVADDVIAEGLDQTARATHYIVGEHGRHFSFDQGRNAVQLLPDDVDAVTEIIVTFERMDPLALSALDLNAESGRAIWVTCLADLLMVVELLDHPAMLLDYATIRSRTSAAGIDIYMESDALGAYFVDRLASVLSHNVEDGERMVMGYSSGAVNDYFTKMEIGTAVEKPVLAVPPVLLDALRMSYDPCSAAWHRAAGAILNASPRVWKIWARFLRKHRIGRPFVVPEGNLVVAWSSTADEVQFIDGERLTFVLPRRGGDI